MRLLIKNGRILDPANGLDDILDLLIEDSHIKEVGKNLATQNAQVIDAAGLWVTPGLIDMHVHLRDPGYRHKETIVTGTRSAAMGGFTTICPMANTNPVTDNEIVVEYIISKASKAAIVHVAPVGSITKGLEGQALSAIGEMAYAGICAISDDGKYVENPALLRDAMLYASMFKLPVLSHCEDPYLTGSIAEELIVARDLILARSTGARLHICHVSAQRSLNHIRMAKAEADKSCAITVEVCPHHFTLCDEDMPEQDANFKMSPPLRSRSDVQAIKAALKDGTIDVIATDHAPHHEDDKNGEFEQAQNGIVGLETAVPLCITELVTPGILTPLEWVAKMTINPASILRLDKGTLSPGAIADITIIDPHKAYTVDKYKFESLSKNTPFHGRRVKGKVMYTIVAGTPVVSEGVLVC
ncbi:MAG: dihydroorotase [Defluviitaleaceae bacterium]|nr:dihydroorotase [Defluviitaleaceae bacterium]